ncbi:hypothetical protein PTSG_03461 [Salpingoeca rosetta]|uniref:Uncharacterized protein n=1 Tax=Salpingoeca rosetta (strain ATCC 50818 / BSB-021) TaxID=946362 RepID=F2U595_SALR5|nr:uncharacterized protein PTSG_03461 [Salpingoeca rosetta]EGD82811.1 hypothetical protein PTSG_03461 [Salpingoeca rosetta]|eukprot:XP_004996046.1 hypothetical protein PTSG_03461 [Salpingoeca rosetta]
MGQRASRDAFDPSKSGPANIGQQGTWRPREQVTRAPTVGSARTSVVLNANNTDDDVVSVRSSVAARHDPKQQHQQQRQQQQQQQRDGQLKRLAPTQQQRQAELAALPSHLEGSIEIRPLDVTAFVDLPLRASDPSDAALHPDWNRWSNIFPNYVSQVLLHPSDMTYVNASWVRSYSPDKACEYIAAETPSLTTLRPFLQMIWNHNVGFMVLLAEIGQPHGQKYWPSNVNQTMHMDDMSVTLAEVDDSKDCYDRLVLDFEHASGATREVVLYWYHAWPPAPGGVPATSDGARMYPRPLVEMMLTVRADRRKTDRRRTPLLVHCNDSVSHTGAYIVLDQAFDCIEEGQPVDVVDLVARSREDRMGIVNATALARFVQEAALQYAFYFLKSHPETPGVVFMRTPGNTPKHQLEQRFTKHRLEDGTQVFVLLSVEDPPAASLPTDKLVLTPQPFDDHDGHDLAHHMAADASMPLHMQPFFKSNFSRSQVEDLLKKSAEASFLVSSSALRPDRLLLSCTSGGRVYHTLLHHRRNDGHGEAAFAVDVDDDTLTFPTAVDAAAWLIGEVQAAQHDGTQAEHGQGIGVVAADLHELRLDDDDGDGEEDMDGTDA